MPAPLVPFDTVTVMPAEVFVSPVPSRATAVNVWLPSAAVVVFHETEYGALTTSLPRLAPSSLNCTPAMPLPSAAHAETTVVPDTIAPAAGDFTDTVGGVVSGPEGTLMILTFEGGQGGAADSPPAASA